VTSAALGLADDARLEPLQAFSQRGNVVFLVFR
jgi:hypothetical protein